MPDAASTACASEFAERSGVDGSELDDLCEDFCAVDTCDLPLVELGVVGAAIDGRAGETDVELELLFTCKFLDEAGLVSGAKEFGRDGAEGRGDLLVSASDVFLVLLLVGGLGSGLDVDERRADDPDDALRSAVLDDGLLSLELVSIVG